MTGNAGLEEVANSRGLTPHQVCIAFLLTVSPWVIPIPGASKVSSAESSAAVGDVQLTDDEMTKLRGHFSGATL